MRFVHGGLTPGSHFFTGMYDRPRGAFLCVGTPLMVMVVNLSYLRTTMVVPRFKAFNGGIFVKTILHDDHFKWVYDCQSSKNLGEQDAYGKNMIYNAGDIVLWQGRFVEILEAVAQTLWKYVSKHLHLAQEARICDPWETTTLVTLAHFLMGVHLTNVLQLSRVVTGACIGRMLYQTLEILTFCSGEKACVYAYLS